MREDAPEKPGETSEKSSRDPIPLTVSASQIPPFPETVPCKAPTSPENGAPGKPWGFWVTIALGTVIFLAVVVAEAMVGVVAILVNDSLNESHSIPRTEIVYSGFILSLMSLIGTPVSCGLSNLFASLRKNLTIRDYLGLRWPSLTLFLRWVTGLIVLIILSDIATKLSGGQVVPDFMIEAHRTAGFLPLFYFAIIVAAPLSEEFLFRGFLLEGLRYSWLGKWGAVTVTAIAWAALHVQYDFRGILTVLAIGLLLGYARIRTGSLWLCALLHLMTNFIASIELLVYLKWFQN